MGERATIDQDYLYGAADAIRRKNGTSITYTPAQFEAAIDAIPTGGITPTGTINITENGTVDVTQYAMANVNVSGGGSITGNDNYAINWDFSNPVNTRGNSSYTSTNSLVQAINGWRLWVTTMNIVTGGITLSPASNCFQTPNSSITQRLLNKQCTLSVLAGGLLEYVTFTVSSTTGEMVHKTMQNGVSMWSYRDDSNTISISLGYDGEESESPIIRAVKLELGSTQTLAHLESGVWVLNNSTSQDNETVKGAILQYW